MTEWHTELAATLDEVWRRLAHGVADACAPARHPALATVGRDGGAEVRTVVLRAADRATARLDVHSDGAAGKIDEIRAEPRVCLHVWDPAGNLQLRLRATAEIVTGAAVAPLWAAVPTPARANYGGTPAPGTPIAAPDDHAARVDAARFAVVSCALREIETLHLGRDRHRRARFRADTDWRGTWLAP
jgi:hypothetical protein